MKKYFLLMAAILFFFASCLIYVPPDEGRYPRGESYGQRTSGFYGDVDFSFFYDYLTPFGSWVRLTPFGYVWVPRHMGYRWRPYTFGHWIWTDYGWTWVSEEEWGWACFHYGRWGWDDDVGWFWVPGADWAPAWVVWRSSPIYFGWAPVPPGVEFSLSFGFRSSMFDIPGQFWVFVEARNFFERRIYPFVIPFERNLTIVHSTELHSNITVRNNRIFNEGIDVDTVRRITRRQITRQNLADMSRPGPTREEGGQIVIYRPGVRRSEESNPKRFYNKDEARQEMGQAKIWDPRAGRTEAQDEAELQKRFEEESRLLDRSQSQELRELRQKFTDEQARARGTVEKGRIAKERDATLAELEKRHAEERRSLAERQKKDREQIRKRIIKK
jgi:hypothetical protein